MRNVQLVKPERSVEKALADDREYKEAMAEGDWGRLADAVHRVVGRTMSPAPADMDQHPWGGYLVVDESTREVVGSCAFKTPPTDEGNVEIAYFTYPGFEGRGYATEMTRRLIELARRSAAVRRIVAHTLPDTSASTRVLEKAGMALVGEVMDPDDGRVWRWQLQVGA
jgi:RimJ/RimL family protein N-acetyltransferase